MKDEPIFSQINSDRNVLFRVFYWTQRIQLWLIPPPSSNIVPSQPRTLNKYLMILRTFLFLVRWLEKWKYLVFSSRKIKRLFKQLGLHLQKVLTQGCREFTSDLFSIILWFGSNPLISSLKTFSLIDSGNRFWWKDMRRSGTKNKMVIYSL